MTESKKVLVRVVQERYIRIVGASHDEAKRALEAVHVEWRGKVRLEFGKHDEREWFHISFATRFSNAEYVAMTKLLRDQLVRHFSKPTK